jgi:hypothetical protein
MAKTNKITQSFNAGELSPLMDSRNDQQKYASGCKTMENFIPLIYGGAERRPGLEYISGAKNNDSKSRLIPFEHSVDDTYILEFSNQSIRFFKDGAIINQTLSVDNLQGIDGLIAHWAMEEDDDNSTVNDIAGAEAYQGSLVDSSLTEINTSVVAATGHVGSGSFDLNNTYGVSIGDQPTLSFSNGSSDSPFSLSGWINFSLSGQNDVIISKYDATTGNQKLEWLLAFAGGKLQLQLIDDNVTTRLAYREADTALTVAGWYHVGATYDGGGGATAADGITLYINGSAVASTATNDASYTAIQDTTASVYLGALLGAGGTLDRIVKEELDSVAIFNRVLTSSEMNSIYTGVFNYELKSPYLTADIPALKFEQSADVMWISHPSYETRKLSRFGDTDWTLRVIDLQTGPFRDQNADTTITITPSATTGDDITLTASGGNVFVTGTTAGHSPSGNLSTSKSQTGALFKLVHSANVASIVEDLDSNTLNDATTTIQVQKGVTWDFITNGTWGTGGPSTIVLERSFDSGSNYETVHTVTSLANRNTVTSGTEDVADAIYRARVSVATGTGTASVQLSIRDTSVDGIVEITSVTSATVAKGKVLKTLGDTTATSRWSEGSFSNRRGFPIDVKISPEERLTFSGNISEPLTTWGSVIGDFTDFELGVDDSDGIQFTLVGTGQQNRIRWMLSKDVLILGTVGGEHLLGASKQDEALTPTNVRARLQTTYGSEDIAGLLVNQATLFVQRGGKKIRELLYDFGTDSHKADDLTVFANHITGDGILETAFQRTPDPTLWCVRSDGQLCVMTYERDQNVFSWYRVVTTDSTSDGEIESVAVIYGGARSEDEVWVSVKRTINSSTVRYIERFNVRELPSSASDYKFLDSYITDTGGDTTITGLSHLEGETVQVLGDGLVQATKVVSGGQITAATTAAKYQVGLGYTSTLIPMDIDIQGTGLSTTKRINRVMVNVVDTIGGTVGPDTSRQETISSSTSKFTGFKKVAIPGGYTRDTEIVAKQTDPLPMTVLSFTYDLGASND